MPDNRLDALARERGFPSYAAMLAWHRMRSENLKKPDAQPQPEQNFLQRLFNSIPIHPSFLLNYSNDQVKKATRK